MYTRSDIDDYLSRLSEPQEKILIEHCNNFDIYPEICAWYDDKEDFYVDWVVDNEIFKTELKAHEFYLEGIENGEFLCFSDGQILRLVL